MRISVEHITRYKYEHEAAYSIQCLRMTPSDFDGQRTLQWNITTAPASTLMPSRDGFGNALHLMTITEPHSEIEIRLAGSVEVENRQGVVNGAPDFAPLRVYLRRTPLTTATAELEDFARAIDSGDRIGQLHELSGRIRDRIDYRPGVTDPATTAAESFKAGHGVCQDHAHVFIAACRTLDIPARYVTGYLLLASEDRAEANHAWAEAWVDGCWHSFDVANSSEANEHHLKLAIGMDYLDACPVRGVRRGGGGEEMQAAAWVWLDQQQQ